MTISAKPKTIALWSKLAHVTWSLARTYFFRVRFRSSSARDPSSTDRWSFRILSLKEFTGTLYYGSDIGPQLICPPIPLLHFGKHDSSGATSFAAIKMFPTSHIWQLLTGTVNFQSLPKKHAFTLLLSKHSKQFVWLFPKK